ncbi:MAG TPA: hypothetical protein VGH63_02325, partial [Polyangia bacterium]
MRDQIKRAAQALEADAAVGAEPAAADADAGGGQGGGTAGKAQARAKKADEYHARHAAWVAEFNELTGSECAGGEGGVKWAAVRAWQQKHWQLNNLLADGLVGPKTIEAAKLLSKKNGPKDEKKDAAGEGAAGGKEHADGKEQAGEPEPQPGAAEGAEASTDKPKLDDETEDAPTAASESHAKLPTPTLAHAKPGKAASLGEFNGILAKIEDVLKNWKAPPGSEGLPQTALAKANGQDVKDPTKEATAHGAMMQHLSEYRSEIEKLTPTVWKDLGTSEKRAAKLTATL